MLIRPTVSSFRRPDKRSAIRHDITEFQTQLPDDGVNALSGLRLRCFRRSHKRSAIRHDITEFQTQLPDGSVNASSGLRFRRFVGLISAAPSGYFPGRLHLIRPIAASVVLRGLLTRTATRSSHLCGFLLFIAQRRRRNRHYFPGFDPRA